MLQKSPTGKQSLYGITGIPAALDGTMQLFVQVSPGFESALPQELVIQYGIRTVYSVTER